MLEGDDGRCSLNVVTYNALIEGLCLSGEADEARKMMSRMRLNGLKEDVANNTSLSKGFCIMGNVEAMFSKFILMMPNTQVKNQESSNQWGKTHRIK